MLSFPLSAALKQTLGRNTGDISAYKDRVQKLQNELIKVSLGMVVVQYITYFVKTRDIFSICMLSIHWSFVKDINLPDRSRNTYDT